MIRCLFKLWLVSLVYTVVLVIESYRRFYRGQR